MLHPSLRSIDAATGATVAELRDEGLELSGFAFSPLPGDTRIAITHERTGERRPAIWDARTGEVTDLPLDARSGRSSPSTGGRTASALLLLQLVDGRHRLHRYDLATGAVTTARHRAGSITAAAVRPDGEVWYRVHNGEHPATAARGRLDDAAARARGSTRARGPAVRAVVVREPQRPAGPRVPRPARRATGPYPVMMRVHGGPHSLDMDRWAPDLQAHVDAGLPRRDGQLPRLRSGSGRRGATSSRGTSASSRSRTCSPASTTSSRAASPTRPGSCSPAGRGAAT